MTARDRLRDDMADALRGFRLDCVEVRRNYRLEQELFRAGIAEILTLRLMAAYAPIFATLMTIERKVAVLIQPYDARDHYGRRG